MNNDSVAVGGASHCVTEHTSLIRAIPINRVKQVMLKQLQLD